MSRSWCFHRKKMKHKINTSKTNTTTIMLLIVICYISTFLDVDQCTVDSSEHSSLNLPQKSVSSHEEGKDSLHSQVRNSTNELKILDLADHESKDKGIENNNKWTQNETLNRIPNHWVCFLHSLAMHLPCYGIRADDHSQKHLSVINKGHRTNKISNKDDISNQYEVIQLTKIIERNNSLFSLRTSRRNKVNNVFKNQDWLQNRTYHNNRIRMPKDTDNKMTEKIISILDSLFSVIKKIVRYECLWYGYKANIIDKGQLCSHTYGLYTEHSTLHRIKLNSAKSPGNAIQPSKFIIAASIILMFSGNPIASTSSARPAHVITNENLNKLKVIHALNAVGQKVLLAVYTHCKGFDDLKSIKDYLINDRLWTEAKFKKKFDKTQLQTINTSNPSGKDYDISLLVKCLRVLSEEHDPTGQMKWCDPNELEGSCKYLKDMRNEEFHMIMGISVPQMRRKMSALENLSLKILNNLKTRFPHVKCRMQLLEDDIYEQMSYILVHPLSTTDNREVNHSDTPQSTLQQLLDDLRISTTNATKGRHYSCMSTTMDCNQYNMGNKNRGRAIIFAYKEFSSEKVKPRDSAPYDAEECQKTFKKLGFQVEVHWDKDMKEFQEILSGIANTDHSQSDALVIVFMSHGGRKDSVEFLRLKDSRVPTEMLTEAFVGCKSLNGKPKLIFIQACRGSDKDQGVGLVAVEGQPVLCKDLNDDKHEEETDSDDDDDDDRHDDTDDDDTDEDDDDDFKGYTIPKHADTLIMWASYQGMKSYRIGTEGSGIKGSVFIHFLCKVLLENHIKDSLTTMLETITRKVATHWESRSKKDQPRYQSKQLPTIRSTLMRTIMFLPKTEQNVV